MIHFDLPKEKSSIIKVIGVGGGGSHEGGEEEGGEFHEGAEGSNQ